MQTRGYANANKDPDRICIKNNVPPPLHTHTLWWGNINMVHLQLLSIKILLNVVWSAHVTDVLRGMDSYGGGWVGRLNRPIIALFTPTTDCLFFVSSNEANVSSQIRGFSSTSLILSISFPFPFDFFKLPAVCFVDATRIEHDNHIYAKPHQILKQI